MKPCINLYNFLKDSYYNNEKYINITFRDNKIHSIVTNDKSFDSFNEEEIELYPNKEKRVRKLILNEFIITEITDDNTEYYSFKIESIK